MGVPYQNTRAWHHYVLFYTQIFVQMELLLLQKFMNKQFYDKKVYGVSFVLRKRNISLTIAKKNSLIIKIYCSYTHIVRITKSIGTYTYN